MSFYKNNFAHLELEGGEDDENGLLWIYLNNPDNRNAITSKMIDSLTNVLKHADYDPAIRVIILSGRGKSFCAGGDIHDMANKVGMFSGDPNQLRLNYMKGIQQIPLTIESLSTPLIAMVNGAAVGAGCDLACMCDIRLAQENASFGETFSKLSLVPGDGGTYFLQRIVGFAKAMEMSLTGDLYKGEKAKEMGLVSHLLKDQASLLERTKELAVKISQNAPIAISMTKKALKHGYKGDLHSQLDLLAAFQGIAQRTEDHFEGLSAFKNKTSPNFKNI